MELGEENWTLDCCCAIVVPWTPALICDRVYRQYIYIYIYIYTLPIMSNVNNVYTHLAIYLPTYSMGGTAAAQWLRCYATNRKVAGSIPVGVIGIFH